MPSIKPLLVCAVTAPFRWITVRGPEGRLNEADSHAGCGDSHVRDRTSRWPSCLWHGNRCTWMGWSLFWDGALGPVLLFATCRLGVVSASGSAAFIWGLRCHWVRRWVAVSPTRCRFQHSCCQAPPCGETGWVADSDTGPCIAAVDVAVVLSAVTQLSV